MLIRPRTRHLLLTLALSLGCKPDPTAAPVEGGEPEGADTGEQAGEEASTGTLPPGEGIAGLDFGAPSEEIQQDPTQPREREPQAAPQTRDAALVAATHGNPEGALAFLKKHLESNKDDVEGALALAEVQRLTGALADAEKTLEKLSRGAKQDADKAEALRRLAWMSVAKGDRAGAEQQVRAAQKLAPSDLLIRGELVRLLFLAGKAKDRECRDLVDSLYAAYSDGTAQSAGELLGTAYAGLAERAFQSTSRVLQEAEEAAPPSKGSALGDQVNLQLADLFLEKYKPSEAAQTLALMLERDAWNPDALVKMGWVLLDQFQLGPASRVAREALVINPEHADAHAILAWIAMIEGDREGARAHVVEHTLKVNPAHHHGQIVMAALSIFTNDKRGYEKARDAVLAQSPINGRFFSQLSDFLGYLHLYPEGDAVLDEAVQRLPRDPYVLAALGLSKLRLGKEAEGREALDKAWRKDKYNARTRNVRELYAEHIEPLYAERVEKDLTLRLPADLQDLVAPGYLGAIGRARRALDKGYGVKISPLRIELYAKPDEFSVRTVGVPSLGALGVCFGPMITAIGPYMGTHNFDQVIWHEIAHSYAISLSAGRVPRWFTEGLSEWESELADPSWARESAELLFEARRHDKLRKLSQLELAFLRAESPLMMEVAYATAAWAMRYLGTTYGRGKIVELLEGYATGKSTDELFQSILGKDLLTVEAEFSAWFDAELDRKLSGWRPQKDKPNDPKLEVFMGALASVQSSDLPGAQTALEQLIADKGDGYHVRMVLGSVVAQQGDKAAAIKHYAAASAFSLESTEPFMAIATVAREQGKLSEEIDQLEKILAIDAMNLEIPLRMVILTAALGDKRLELALARANAIAPLHPVALAGSVVLLKQNKGDKARMKALLDEAMVTALQPDAGLDVVVMAALAADAINDPRVADLAPRAIESKELPDAARKRLHKRVP